MRRPVDLAPAPAGRDEHEKGAGGSRCVARFEIRFTRYLSSNGHPIAELPPFARDPLALVPLYESMVLTRLFDRKAVALQRTGQLGTFPSSLGQEAASVGIGAAMAKGDVLLGTYRETGTMLVRGVRMLELLLYWGGDERGSAYSGPDAPSEDFPICVPIATHAPHAVGVAYAFKQRREARAAVCVLGDGATSKGDFYEALNAAAVWQVPAVFVVVNNEWAISVPRHLQSRAETLAQKAIAAGVDGEQVDGNDVVAVRNAVDCALVKARRGGGPHLIEALTYRMSDHTTADDARRYRSEQDLERYRALDPVTRLRAHLVRERAWNDERERRLRADCTARVEQAAADYLAMLPQPAESMFDYLFEQLPEALREQRNALAEESARRDTRAEGSAHRDALPDGSAQRDASAGENAQLDTLDGGRGHE